MYKAGKPDWVEDVTGDAGSLLTRAVSRLSAACA